MTSGRPPADLIATCATAAEARAARRAGFRTTAVVGIGASRGVPAGRIVSFGVAGGLDGLEIGTLIDATRIVAEDGTVLWEGQGLGISGAERGTILAIGRIADDRGERARLRAASGADAVDMESGILAATGRLEGCVRAVSDTPTRPLGPLAAAVSLSGRPRPLGLAKALLREPSATARALGDVRRALRSLGAAG